MNLGDRLLLGINTTITAVLIVFVVLIFLGYVIKIISLFVEKMNLNSHKTDEVNNKSEKPVLKEELICTQTTGSVSGELNLEAELNDEEAAAILAVIAHELKRPLNEVKIKSIKLINR
ncbi:MAG: sodium pump decarboxylase, gamma subunit [Caloramator sp.]|uniref:OadG family protein n=1 Tax=Caloramator sp. TaxID=1871330 RepID=UPI001D2E2B6D|nr:OadG family protein [Caloramator sp.]MBZ4664432.1 sodium pump decarboxylase, gamma subunit [Caloramator sp.]